MAEIVASTLAASPYIGGREAGPALARELACQAGLALARELMASYPESKPVWHYEHGLFLQAAAAAGEAFGDRALRARALSMAGALVREDGSIASYKVDEENLDQVNPGKNLFDLLTQTGDARYRKAIELLRGQLRRQPRCSAGGYWHKKIYPNQMWLDGLYMAQPFCARYAKEFGEEGLFDDCVKQFALVESKAREPRTGLFYHAWDEARIQLWADPETGCSPNFWGRAMGWFAMALVDSWEWFPEGHSGRLVLEGIFEGLARALIAFQEPESGLWYQVVDRGGFAGNYLEASVSAMLSYAFAKALRLGMSRDAALGIAAERAYSGCLRRFLVKDASGRPRYEGTCAVAGLGGNPYRDGSYAYYVGEPVKANDYKGAGPFILASIECDSRRPR